MFPKDGDTTKSRDANGWRLAIEARLGAVNSIHAFLANCPELVTGDAHRLIVRCLSTAVRHCAGSCRALTRSQIDMLGQIPTGAKAGTFADSKNALHTRIYEAFNLVSAALANQESLTTIAAGSRQAVRGLLRCHHPPHRG